MDPRTLDYALTRHAVVFANLRERWGNQAHLDLGAFLAGWFLAVHELPFTRPPINHPTETSILAGHREGTSALTIWKREQEDHRG
jgi:hypothetical protein